MLYAKQRDGTRMKKEWKSVLKAGEEQKEQSATIHVGDCLTVLKKMKDESFDACFCDPPYGMNFMGKRWDHGVPSAKVWKEVYRVLKPGGFLLAFGGTRTFHRLATAIEDAGFEIRDTCCWLYGSGFPKSADISKQLDKKAGKNRTKVVGRYKPPDMKGEWNLRNAKDKRTVDLFSSSRNNLEIFEPATEEAKLWNGYGTALKPAYEPIVVAMKPTDGTFAENALKYGVAGLNIDGSRISASKDDVAAARVPQPKLNSPTGKIYGFKTGVGRNGDEFDMSRGRFPANILLDEEAARLLDQQSGVSTNKGHFPKSRFKEKSGYAWNMSIKVGTPEKLMNDTGGASRFFYVAKASRSERNAGLDGMKKRESGLYDDDSYRGQGERKADHTTAKPRANHHPTVKPITLNKYLAKMVLPPQNGRRRKLLVPFSGSGSEMIGALRVGWDKVVGIEKEADYVDIAEKRIKHWNGCKLEIYDWE